MCLRTTMIHSKKAESDITCYKLVFKKDKFISIVINFKYELNKLYKAKGFVKVNREKHDFYCNINNGFHSYRTLKDAKEVGSSAYVVLKCIIPKGTEYWENSDMGWTREYCSQKIKTVAWKPMWNGKWSETF